MHRATRNELVEMEWMSGELEMTEEEYSVAVYRPDQLHLKTGGRYFRPHITGAGYHRGVGAARAVVDVRDAWLAAGWWQG